MSNNNNSWIPEAIRTSSDSVHQSFIAFTGVAAYCALTLTSITDRDLLLNNRVELPVLSITVSLQMFAIVGPILTFIFFLYMHVGLVNLAELLTRGKKAGVTEGVWNNFINRFLSQQLGFSKPGFLERVQYPLFLLGLYLSLPFILALTFITFVKIRDPVLSNALLLSLVGSIIVSGMFYLAITDPGFEITKKQITNHWKHFLFLILIPLLPFDLLNMPLIMAFYVGYYLYPALLLLLILVSVVRMALLQTVRSALRPIIPLFILWVLIVALTIASAYIHDSYMHGTLFPLWIGLAIIGGAWTLNMEKPIHNLRVLTLVALCSITGHSIWGLFRDTAQGYILNLDVSYQEFVSTETEAGTSPTATFNLSDRNFQGAKMNNTTLSRVHFRNSNLEDVEFQGADLRKADFTEATLFLTNFSKAFLQGAVFYNSNLTRASFAGADLSGSNIDRCELSVNMEGANLDSAKITSCDLSKATDLTVSQLLKVSSLLYSKLPPNIEQQIVKARPDLVFHKDYGLSRDLPTSLMYLYKIGDTVSTAILREDLVYLPWNAKHYPDWKQDAYLNFYTNRSIELLIHEGYLQQLSQNKYLVVEGKKSN